MQIGNWTNSGYIYSANRSRQGVLVKDRTFSPAVTKTNEKEEGEFLGLTMLPEEGKLVTYGMSASLLKESTPDNPIVQIISNLDGKTEIYHIAVNEVDPQNASRMEMFALCSYADKCGMGTGSTFGSFHTFKMYEEMAKQNGYMKQTDVTMPAWDQFRNEKLNWVKISEQVLESLKTINDPGIFDLFSKGKKLLNLYAKYTKNSTENIEQKVELKPFEETGKNGAARFCHGIKKVVIAVNPEDGKEYSVYFTDKNIVCQSIEEDGKTAWTMEITEEQYKLVEEYFEKFENRYGKEPEWYADEELGKVSSKDFWIGFFEGAQTAEDSSEISDEDYAKLLRRQIEELREKIEKGEVNESFQIGGQTFTIKEWEAFLKKFDSIQEIIEALMKERHDKQEEERIKQEMESDEMAVTEMLFSESISSSVPASDWKEYETENYKFVPETDFGKGF